MSRKIIVTVALTGGLHTKAANPNLPEQPDEIAKDAGDSFNEGAAIAHLHARDPADSPSGDSAIYRRIHAARHAGEGRFSKGKVRFDYGYLL